MDKRLVCLAIAVAAEPPKWIDDKSTRDDSEVDNMKPNMSFYQTKMHRKKKGGRVNFK